ncbi:phage terminase large subunit [Sphingomonas sp.]|uniref:phage terminase large subunit n=1 Tax=Sphingomonas sp. TaxID=28214 RepID=UPI003B3B747A
MTITAAHVLAARRALVEQGDYSFVEMPPKLRTVFEGEADARGSFGGRGSGKTRTFAKMTAYRAVGWDLQKREGIILCTRQFMNSLAESSLEEIKAAIREDAFLAAEFELGEKYVRTKSGRVSYAFSGLDRNIDSIKSKSRILLNWTDEAEKVSEEAWSKLIPTLREDDSENWVTWNPESKRSPTHQRFRLSKDPRYKIVEMSWRDNPWFPDILDRQRLRDKEERPDSYSHIWEGDFANALEGAYFAKHIQQAKEDGRISNVSFDPLMTVRLFVDIGGTGARADAFTIWPAQFIGREIRVRDYYETVGQPLAAHLNWLRSKGYTPDRAQFWLPHDGATQDKVYDVSYESALRDAGYKVTVIPNQGKGAAAARIEMARRLFPQIWFDKDTTEAGRDALGWYHENKDDKRGVGLGPLHDWSSHGADSFGLMCVAYEEPRKAQQIDYSRMGRVA